MSSNVVPGPGALRATIYARRSTDRQEDSVPRQLRNARDFIRDMGWLEVEPIYAEEGGACRAEFVRRRGLTALLAAAARKPRPFDVVVVRDETRLGGDMARTTLVLQDLVEAGVAVWYYQSREQVRLESATDKAVVTIRNLSSEIEREKAVDRSYEAALDRFEAGYVAGGKTYGYRNVAAPDGSKHKVREIDPEEAAVVVDIWRAWGEGHGYRAIAVDLNARGVPPPRAGRRGTGSWAPSCIREITLRDLYVGIDRFNRTQKAMRGGTRCRLDRPVSQWVEREVPHLRIVPPEVEVLVRDRRERAAKMGRPPSAQRGSKGQIRNLLSGLARCTECGGPVSVENGWKDGGPAKVYACQWHRDRGICGNGLRRPVEDIDEAVFELLEAHVLREELAAEVVAEMRERLCAPDGGRNQERKRLETELRRVRTEIQRLMALAAAAGDNPDVQEEVIAGVSAKKRRVRDLEARLAAARVAPGAVLRELDRLEAAVASRLRHLRGALRRNPVEAREVLEAVLDGPVEVTPVRDGRKGRFRLEMRLQRDPAPLCAEYGVPNRLCNVAHGRREPLVVEGTTGGRLPG